MVAEVDFKTLTDGQLSCVYDWGRDAVIERGDDGIDNDCDGQVDETPVVPV